MLYIYSNLVDISRYLMVECDAGFEIENSSNRVPSVVVDPKYQPKINGKVLTIPEPNYKLEQLLKARRSENVSLTLDEDDIMVSNGVDPQAPPTIPTSELKSLSIQADWQHDPRWVASCAQHLLAPPRNAFKGAKRRIQKALKAMLEEQKNASRLDELGWYIPPESIKDNIFQWVVELHSFDRDLPLAQEMKEA